MHTSAKPFLGEEKRSEDNHIDNFVFYREGEEEEKGPQST